ncbi:unnamed protein product, partial [Iphiclides podalirius]
MCASQCRRDAIPDFLLSKLPVDAIYSTKRSRYGPVPPRAGKRAYTVVPAPWETTRGGGWGYFGGMRGEGRGSKRHSSMECNDILGIEEPLRSVKGKPMEGKLAAIFATVAHVTKITQRPRTAHNIGGVRCDEVKVDEGGMNNKLREQS